MSVTLASPPVARAEAVEQRFVIGGVRWDTYETICDALTERGDVRLIYNDGTLIFMGKSRLHERLAVCLDQLVLGIAVHMEIDCEPSGEATFRRRQKEAGVEGDGTFHFGVNAERMRGMENYNFEVDPPPDLAIEVETSHPADDAVTAWGRLAVPELWRCDATTFTCTFWNSHDNGTYEQVARSLFLPMLDPSDVVEQMRRAREFGTTSWIRNLEHWVRDVLRPRLDGGGS